MKNKSSKPWQISTAICLFVGYSGYYLCRSNLAIAAPLIIQEYAAVGVNKVVMGQIAALGVVFYAVGKVINGVLGDFIGGKKVFILGMLGSVLATIFFGFGKGVLFFGAVWSFNRLIQSMGWGGLLKITANWFSYKSYGKIMSFLSLSFLVGDIVAKLLLGHFLNLGMGWRGLFYIAAGLLVVIAMINVLFLKNSPENVGLVPPPPNPKNLHAQSDNQLAPPASLRELLAPYFKNLSFILILLMSFGLTAIREALNFWLPTYLFETTNQSEGLASQYSALYSAFGMISILVAGYLSDAWMKGVRGLLIAGAGMLLTVVLGFMAVGFTGQILPLIFISLAGLLLLGPYSFLAGAMSLDVGGPKGAATAGGLVDAVGYLGGTLALWLTGFLAEYVGWNAAFLALAAMAVGTACTAFIYYRTQESHSAKSQPA
ncbi:MFS transporter [Adhaeribacter arboris]|uniref:MFS transporter n=1 Tax=Adhaeribacter arboris TaxID=2072846 RepID=UPI0013050261|nr:MFS transporter [Adhaeribacter arboris]